MKDLIAKLQSDACVAIGAIWLHIDAQAARIAELEAQIAASADTNKLREAILNLHCSESNSEVFIKGFELARDVAAYTVTEVALQAPVREVPGWQPIETAPKDGTHVLCYAPELQFVGFFGDPIGKWCYMAPGVPLAPTQPTHWMPLPAAPVQQEPKP